MRLSIWYKVKVVEINSRAWVAPVKRIAGFFPPITLVSSSTWWPKLAGSSFYTFFAYVVLLSESISRLLSVLNCIKSSKEIGASFLANFGGFWIIFGSAVIVSTF